MNSGFVNFGKGIVFIVGNFLVLIVVFVGISLLI